MPSGDRRPFISLESVRAALDALVHVSTARSPSPLERLLLVDEFLANPDFPQSTFKRSFALDDLLITVIKQEYQRLRSVFRINLPQENAQIENILAQVNEDLRIGSLELIGWGLLYVRYVRSDLGLTLEALSQVLHTESRTLRRYLHHAFEKLTEQLIQREWAARTRQRKRRLLSELPSSMVTPLFGREQELQKIGRILRDPGRHHLIVTGMAGIGKSALVQEVLRQQIESEAIERLIWIYQPATVASVRRCLIERLLTEGSGISLGEYLLIYRVAIVLDGVEALENERNALDTLLDELSAAIVFLTSQLSVPMRGVTTYIGLSELNETDTARLVLAIAPHNAEVAGNAYHRSGGNPLMVKLAAQVPGHFDDLGLPVYHQLDQPLWRILCMFVLFPPGPVNQSRLFELWPTEKSQEHIGTLLRRYLIEEVEQDHACYSLAMSVRKHIQQLYARNHSVRAIVGDLLDQISLETPSEFLDVIEHILLSEWLEIDLGWRQYWIERLWRDGLRQGHFASWCSIFEWYFRKTELEDVTLLTAYGISLRRLLQWDDAETVFGRALRLAGQTGAFLEQARVALELGVLHRYRGHHDRVERWFTQVEDTLKRYSDDDLATALRFQQAQVALERGNASDALYLLSTMDNTSPDFVILKSEVCLLLGEWEQSLSLAQQILGTPGITVTYEGRGHAIIGRCYERLDNLSTARQHLEHAVTILEQEDDLYALARAHSNLGAVLTQQRCYDDAQALLERARHVQIRIGDKLGLAATRHNLRLAQLRRVESLP